MINLLDVTLMKATLVISFFGLLFFQRLHALTVAQVKLTNLKFHIYQGEGFYNKYSETERDQLVDKLDLIIKSLKFITVSKFIVCLIFFKFNPRLFQSLSKNQLIQKLAADDLRSIGKTLNWLIFSRSFIGIIMGSFVFPILFLMLVISKRTKEIEIQEPQVKTGGKQIFFRMNTRISKLVIETVLAFRSNNGHRLFG
ncbi:MAG: hypothetical protein QM523_10110 [Candidatus Pacebacteria bacterium]|nr:hypothetical protein [Candidatus Paceibacterota bacterium]